MSHTKTPWKVEITNKTDGESLILPMNEDDGIIAIVAGGLGWNGEICFESLENANFIAQACNSYETMREALEALKQAIKPGISADDCNYILDIIDRTLTQVRK